MLEKWSPDDFTRRWNLIRQNLLTRIESLFACRPAILTLFIFCTLAAAGVGAIMTAEKSLEGGRSQIAHSVFKLTVLFIEVSFAHLLILPAFHFSAERGRRLIWLFSLPVTAAVAFATFKALSPVQIAACTVFLLAEFFLMTFLFRFSRRFHLLARLLFLGGAMMLQAWTTSFLENYVNIFRYAFYFVHSRWFMIFSYLALEEHIRRGKPETGFFALFSPTNFIDPVPAPQSSWQPPHRPPPSLLLKGWFDLLSCYAAAVLLAYMMRSSSDQTVWELSTGFFNYVTLFLISYVTIVLPVGLLRLYGFPLKDAFETPLLAATPQDRWRRWNTFYYQWFYSMVFWPVFKRTRILWLACVAVFLVTYWFHVSHLIFTAERAGGWQSPSVLLLGRYLGFFMAHAAAVYVGIRLHRFWPAGRRLVGWFGVLATWLLMGAIHMIKW